MPEIKKIEELAVDLKSYVNTNYELLKLEAAERSSVIGSGLFSSLLVMIVVIFLLLFLSIAAALYISRRFEDNYTGFLFVAGFYLLVGIILLLGRKKLLADPFRDRIIRKLFSAV